MKVIKESSVKHVSLMHIQYDKNDFEELTKKFGSTLSPNTIRSLCDYLDKNSAFVYAKDCYDPQSGWFGTEFIINGTDLSINGYCLTGKSVTDFINKSYQC